MSSRRRLFGEAGDTLELKAGPLKRRFHSYSRRIPWVILLVGVVLIFWPPRTLRSDNFVFYLAGSVKTIPIQSVGHADYLPLLQVLNMVVHVDGMQASQASLKVWFGPSDVEVHLDDRKVRVNKNWVTLEAPVRAENGEWLVPLDFMASALPQLTHQPVQYRVGARRIFIGDVKPGSFSVRLKPLADGADILVAFTEKVSIKTEAANGRWILYLGGRPIEPLEARFVFQNPFVKSLQFDDQDGVPKFIVTPATEGLDFHPALAEDGKALEAEVAKQRTATTLTPLPPTNPPSLPPPAAPEARPTEELPAVEGAASAPLVVLDPGHGGPDPGSHDKNGVLEKDLVLSLAMRVRAVLLASGHYRVALTRSGDSDLTFDRRDTIANVLHASVFLTFHAGDFGAASPRVVVYSFEPPAPWEETSALAGAGMPRLIPWEHVQDSQLDRSHELAGALEQQLAAVPGLSAPKAAQAPARVLRSVGSPAVAIEIGSFAPDIDSAPLSALSFEQQLAGAILKGLDAFKKF
jgi:N-acetylmuramoyl-L-alanine amidase